VSSTDVAPDGHSIAYGQYTTEHNFDIWVFDTASGPGRMTALITNNGNQWCTGFLIGPSTLATAAHCLHPGGVGQSWFPASALRVYPAYNASAAVKAPYGSCGAVTLHATAAWTSSSDDQYDYGAIQLDCTIGNQTGWFGWWWQPKSLDGQITKIFGYPGDRGAQAWKAKDYVRVSEPRRVFYANDTVGGNSGSPVFRFRGATELGCQGWCVMAVHAYGIGWDEIDMIVTVRRVENAAREAEEECIELCLEMGDKVLLARSFFNLGFARCAQGEPEEGRSLLGKSLAICRESKDGLDIFPNQMCLFYTNI
jgi:V8-like Glu-specific endopeptidase